MEKDKDLVILRFHIQIPPEASSISMFLLMWTSKFPF